MKKVLFLVVFFSFVAETYSFNIYSFYKVKKKNHAVSSLSPFNLQVPAANIRVMTIPGSPIPIVITWDTSAADASYKFIFGSPSASSRKLVIPSATNSISITLGELDNILAENGWTANGSATDSAVGQWDVWAFKAPGTIGLDSLKSANGPRSITFRRSRVTMSPFNLIVPVNGTTILTSAFDKSELVSTWSKTGTGARYKWMFSPSFAFFTPPFVVYSDNNGYDTSATFINSTLDLGLENLGLNRGDSVNGQWRVVAYGTSGDSLISTQTRNLTLKRLPYLSLNQNFESETFPPVEWNLLSNGTQYWTREAPSGYGAGAGSARFAFFNAPAGTEETLISNTFPPVTNINKYLRFNYASKFSLSNTAQLKPDSVEIYTSDNDGGSWNLLITMKASVTPQLGNNSTSNMSTTGGQSQYTSPANNEWATKIYEMPKGSNKVKFVAHSANGNNLFIDNISAGGSVGVINTSNFAPAKYELSQNFPNPFNPATRINFAIPKHGLVTLKVYNIIGKEVANLVNTVIAAGIYSVDFSGINFSSGVYFYRIEAGDFVETKRMMLIK